MISLGRSVPKGVQKADDAPSWLSISVMISLGRRVPKGVQKAEWWRSFMTISFTPWRHPAQPLYYKRVDSRIVKIVGSDVALLVLFFFFFLLYTLLSLSGNTGLLTWVRLQQPQEERYPVLQVHDGSFRVSVIYRTLTDMDYKIFNVRSWSFLYVRIHTKDGHTDSEFAQHFWIRKSH